jgi:hypothetical protein
MIYVNGKLVMVSKEIPLLDLRKLNDTYDKQESVPFNLSLGGGTQGLADVFYTDFRKLPEYVLPLEEGFGGSFIGYFKSFKFYNCLLNFNEIGKNYEYEMSLINGTYDFDPTHMPRPLQEVVCERITRNKIKQIIVDPGGHILGTTNLSYDNDDNGKVLGIENGRIVWVDRGLGKHSGFMPAHTLAKTIPLSIHKCTTDVMVQVYETIGFMRRMVLADVSVSDIGDVTISVTTNPNGLYYDIIG